MKQPYRWGFPGGASGKEPTCKNRVSIPELGRSPGGWHGNPLQYSCLEKPHGQRTLAGYSQSDVTEVTQHSASQQTYVCLSLYLQSCECKYKGNTL